MKIAVIPARGGSQRIVRKNIKSFAGKPIIAYSIKSALASKLFDRVIVSTDDLEIAERARHLGAETPFIRPLELSDHITGTNAVVKHAIEWLGAQGAQVEYACCIYATAPFLQPEYLIKAYEDLLASQKEFAFSVTHYKFPVQRALVNRNETISPLFPEFINKRSQDLEEVFHDAAQFYWGKASSFCAELAIFAEHSLPIFIPHYLVQDIDTIEDWKSAERMYLSLAGSLTND